MEPNERDADLPSPDPTESEWVDPWSWRAYPDEPTQADGLAESARRAPDVPAADAGAAPDENASPDPDSESPRAPHPDPEPGSAREARPEPDPAPEPEASPLGEGSPEGEAPVFYVQERVGLRGQPFRIVKFRTMRVDAEAGGPVWARVDDDRVTRFGRLLRSTHLDELPQFFNVLRREMSLIGPRPERPVFVRLLGRAIPYFDRRHLVRPGVTGWAVVRFGYSDSIRDKWIIHEHDLYYLKHCSVLLDLEIAV